jgi:hypothetical protein
VEIEGTDKVVVTGEVDSVKLAHALKKKFGHVMIVSVKEEKEEKKEEKKTEEKDVLYWPNNYFHHYPPPMVYEDTYSPYQPPTCSIL